MARETMYAKGLLRTVLIGGLLALVAATFLPVWTIWHLNPMEGVGHRCSLWSTAWTVAGAWLEDPDPAFP
jgi:hypothetical protein